MKALVSFLVILIFVVNFATTAIGQNKHDINGSSWNDIVKNGKGTINFYWYRSVPYIYREDKEFKGVEYELSTSFVQFIESKYDVSLTIRWIEASSFESIIGDIQESHGGVFGMSGVSITEERENVVQFTPPYLNDICVIVTSPNVVVESTFSDFVKQLENLTALTIKGSTFERKLLEIEKEEQISLNIEYIPSTSNLIQRLKKMKDGFGYIDLPTFLIELNKGTTVRRQYFFPLKLIGLSLVYPIDNDWEEPIEAYFTSEQFQMDKERVIDKYFGADIKDLIDQMTHSDDLGLEEEIIMLSQEREFQYQELLKKNKQMKRDQQLMIILILTTLAVLLLSAILYIRYRLKLSVNRKLAEKQAEIELKNVQLTDLNNEKDQLIEVLAHDLRAPISRMLGVTEILSHDIKKDQLELVDLIVKEANSLNRLITKILDVEAIDRHQHNLHLENVDIVEIIKELVDDYQTRSKEKEIKIETVFANKESKVVADQVYLRQVLENLLSNALKFSNSGTKIQIQVDDQTVIHISDQGPGFTEDDQQKIFKKFQRLSAKPTGNEQSTGLGLATVKLFVDLMNGEITLDTIENEGTTFHLKFPLSS